MYNLNAELRTEDFGSAGSRRLIKAGKLPAVIYGKDSKPIHIALDYREFALAVRTMNKGDEVSIKLDKKQIKCRVHELQENVMTSTLIHVDFVLA